ncbi:hypothetical protein TPA0908_29040 [Micromonospora sp. AKA38]|nr:hypothetical protein TPA0908_29040 [Micromonospora sp. AKA38]
MPRWKWFLRSNEPVDVVQRPTGNQRPRVIRKRNDTANVLPLVGPPADRAAQARTEHREKRRNGGAP